jgi:IS1 family transposase
MGKNIRSGANYTPFIVYDLDGDGKAEVVCRTADGTIDGVGNAGGDPKADWREPEGAAIDQAPWMTNQPPVWTRPPRHMDISGRLWAAIDADTKLVPCWLVGPRTPQAARDFIEDLAGRLEKRVQLTTDSLKMYVRAVSKAFGGDIDYAMLVKVYGKPEGEEKRYSPAVCIACESYPINGNPDPKHISTSYVERHNLSVRMTNRRFTRLTNAFSKKIENHAAAVSLGYFAYNFIKIHRTLRVTPAMAAGVTNRLWEVADLVALWEAYERGKERAA